jgi:hypothetical protein
VMEFIRKWVVWTIRVFSAQKGLLSSLVRTRSTLNAILAFYAGFTTRGYGQNAEILEVSQIH